MKKPKIILTYVTTLSLLPFVLTGCGEKSKCELPERHVHKYVRYVNNDVLINKYLEDEELSNFSGYTWTGETIDINSKDAAFYDKTYDLIDEKDNWDYLYYMMASSKDYLEFWYEYDTTQIVTSTDSKGHTTSKVVTHHHEGWHQDSRSSNNTGKFRIVHYQFHGYKVIYENGKFYTQRSYDVDDVREILSDYPYFYEDFRTHITSKNYKISKNDLWKLDPYDPQYNTFNHPDLTNKSKDLNGNAYTKK